LKSEYENVAVFPNVDIVHRQFFLDDFERKFRKILSVSFGFLSLETRILPLQDVWIQACVVGNDAATIHAKRAAVCRFRVQQAPAPTE